MKAHVTLTVSEMKGAGSNSRPVREVSVTLDGEYVLVNRIVDHLKEFGHYPDMEVS